MRWVAGIWMLAAGVQPVTAKEWPVTAGWTIEENEERSGCRMDAFFGDDARLRIDFFKNESPLLTVADRGLRSPATGSGGAELSLDEGRTFHPSQIVYFTSEGTSGFIAPINAFFVEQLMTADSLTYVLPALDYVKRLDVKNSGEAVSMLRRCVDEMPGAGSAAKAEN
ncbi:hypothetical protein IC614_05820 [Allosphingosinicella flava]|uniref:Uncharacterized protein n=1 Tax=Allosphingosinicella flava TaxID=2771430 RepID=A0A7T2GLJ3_9SPHN|nr:hypothetical protein [Sphingosinicella flava]QPQ56086.1 hypothetical protein IC614_05820 [Sphingosinicella flava]